MYEVMKILTSLAVSTPGGGKNSVLLLVQFHPWYFVAGRVSLKTGYTPHKFSVFS